MSPFLISSTNWFVAGGSLDGSISFETSSTEGEDVIPIGVLLEKPVDSPPCEITILFREKHEIHSIYVRSTARIYEIYYASDKRVNNNEYLCTVRCGVAVQEVTAECTVPDDINEVLPRSDSNNAVEDGWVDVKIPDSFLQDNRRHSLSNTSVENICPKTQIQYEATAEISDASPCMSVTLRFLSLEIKTSVRIEEIYIYADPVEDTDFDPPVNNGGAGSLLSMLVPSLLQLSKSGTSRLQDKGFSDISGLKYSTSSEVANHASCPEDMLEILEMENASMMGNSKVMIDQQRINEKLEHPLLASSKTVNGSDQASKPKADENNGAHDCVENVLDNPTVNDAETKAADGKFSWIEEEKVLNQSLKTTSDETNATYVRLEKILDELLSRVGRIETFCSSLHESIIKPLTGIDIRLQRMEKQLDSFTKVPQSSEANPSSMFSCLSAHESDFEPSSHEKETPVDTFTVSLPEFQNSGLAVKAPEFPNDDDDDESTNNGNSVDLTPNEHAKSQCLSIDSALVSALAAFLSSTTDIGSVHNPHPMDVSNEQQHSVDHFLDSIDVHSETYNNSFVECVLANKNCDMPDEARDELSESDKSYSDVVISDCILNKFDTFDRTKAKQHDGLYDDSYSSAEVDTYNPNGLIIRAPEFPNEDDVLDSGEILDPHVSSYTDAISHVLPDTETTSALALFLSSRRFSPSKGSPDSHFYPLKPSNADIKKFSLSTFQVHGGFDGMRTSNLERSAHIEYDPSLVGFFLSENGSEPKKVDIYDHTETSSFMGHINSMEDVNHVLKCDGLLSNGTSKGCAITENLLPCSGLGSSICVQDKECLYGNSKELNVGITESMSDFLGSFEVADNITSLSSDSIFMSSELHFEYSDSSSMDSFTGAFAVSVQHSAQTGDSGSPGTTVHCQSFDGISQMKSLFEPKQMSSFIPGQDDLTSNVKFCADKNVRSWLPLEILLGEKPDDKPHNSDQLKLVQEDLVSNLEFSVDRNMRSRLPLEVLLDEKSDDKVEVSCYANSGFGKKHSSLPVEGFRQGSEGADNSLLDMEDIVVQSEISSMANTASTHDPFSSLI